MNVERPRRRTFPSLRTSSANSSQYGLVGGEPEAMDSKKPRVLSKALRTLSNSSLEPISPTPSRTSLSTRRLQKAHSGSGSMIERLHRRVSSSKDLALIPSPTECPATPPEQPPYASMEVVQHGPLKTDVSLLKARAEYLVLTDQCLVKFSNVEAAMPIFTQLRQVEAPARASSNKPTPTETRLEIPLRSIVAVFNEEGSSPRFGIEVNWFSPWPRLAYSKTHFFFALPQERDSWLGNIQRACRDRLRRSPVYSAIPENLKTRINHIVETAEPASTLGGSHNLIFPVAKRTLPVAQKANAAEEPQNLIDGPSFYLVIGPCMCYFIEVLKADYLTLPGDLRLKVHTFGTVTLTRFKASVASYEQRYVMCFR